MIGALGMTIVQALSRLSLGASLPAELGGDRFLPHIHVNIFLFVLGIFGGPNTAKTVTFFAALAGQLVVGALIGFIYATIVERERSHNPMRPWPLGLSRNGTVFVVLAIAVIWLVSYIVFGPVLAAGYTGQRPEVAAITAAEALLAGYVVYGLLLIVANRLLAGRDARVRTALAGRTLGRQALLAGALGVGLAVASGVLIRRLYGMGAFGYDGTQALGPHIDPITANDRFYVVTKNLIDPHIAPGAEAAAWRFELRGLIARPDDFNIDEIMALPAVRQETTLECISNPIGGGLISNAVWTGVPLRTLIEHAGPQAGIASVLLRATDGYEHSLSYAKAMEPTTILAYAMNGAPLPQRHGYPARLLVPGYYGEGSMKWVTRIELVAHEEGGYYEQQGWKDRYVHTSSRIDTPVAGQPSMRANGTMIPVQGIAFAADRGVANVEVSLDGGQTWRQATITYRRSRLTWALWRYNWHPEGPGTYHLMVRATDGHGAVQTARVQPTNPMGATGYHEVTVHVTA